MKTHCRSVLFFAVFTGFLLLTSSPLAAVPFVHADVQMSNAQWNPSAGTLNWLIDWELSASAAVFDSVNGFVGEANTGTGHPATVTASAVGANSSAFAQVVVDSSGEVLLLQSSMDLTFTPGDVFVSAFPQAFAYREFMLTGGSGPVDVSFSFDYLAHLQGDAPELGADFRALLSISYPFDLAVSRAGTGLMNDTFSGTLSQTLPLQYDVPYAITFSVDGDLIAPESGPGVLLTTLTCLFLFGLRSLCRSKGCETEDRSW